MTRGLYLGETLGSEEPRRRQTFAPFTPRVSKQRLVDRVHPSQDAKVRSEEGAVVEIPVGTRND